MLSELDLLLERINAATQADEVFGELDGTTDEQLENLKATFRRLSRAVHPDRHGNSPAATQAFARLSQLRDEAAVSIEAGTYGQPNSVTVQTKRHRYDIGRVVTPFGVATCYECVIDGTQNGVIAVAMQPSDNDLLQMEARVLRTLMKPDQPSAGGYMSMLPSLFESFKLTEAGKQRQANVFRTSPGYATIAAIHEAYPAGINPKDMAWMWRRLLDVLGYAHHRGFVHGAVLPGNILIGLGDVHEVVITNWQAATPLGGHGKPYIPLIDASYQQWYPPEVAAKQPPSQGTDLLMSARTMCYLLGGNPLTGDTPPNVPARVRGFIKSCLLLAAHQRPQDAWRLRSEFTELINELWGKREYRPFFLPT